MNTLEAIIGMIACGIVLAILFIRGVKSEDDEPFGDEAGQVYPVSVDNEVKKGYDDLTD